MSKDKKAKKAKKAAKRKSAPSSLKTLVQNPLVADVVAAALVATAAALKDSKRAQALASDASDELAKLSKSGAERGSALWEMAMQIGRRSLEALTSDQSKPAKAKAKPKPKAKKDAKKPGARASRA